METSSIEDASGNPSKSQSSHYCFTLFLVLSRLEEKEEKDFQTTVDGRNLVPLWVSEIFHGLETEPCVTVITSSLGFSTRKPTHTSNNGVVSFRLMEAEADTQLS